MNSWPELDRRCTGTNRAGERCGRAPIPGGTVCVLHGGGTPVIKAAAKTRLLAMVEPVLGVFESIVETYHSTRCATCGKPTGDPAPVIRVGQLVLDRAGFHPTLTVEQSAPAPNPFANMTPEQLEERALRLVDMARSMRLPPMQQLPEVTDAVLVDELITVPESQGANPGGETDPPEEDGSK